MTPRLVALALVALAWAGLAPAARADRGDPLPVGWKTTIVGVLPVATIGTDLFGDAPQKAPPLAAALAWRHTLEASFQRDQVEVLTADVLRDRLQRAPDIKRTVALAADRYDLGLDRWKALQAKEALGHLDRARDLHKEAFSRLADPKAMADVEFQRGLVLRELGDEAGARAAFVAALELDPGRRVARGYYDADTEKVLGQAQAELADRPDPLGALWPADVLVALADRLGLDVIGLMLLEPDGTLRLVVWDARTRAPARSEAFATNDKAHAERALDRALSAWHACALQAEQGLVRPTWRPHWYADLGYVHSVWLRHRRTRDFLQGPGAQIGVTFEPSPGLEVFFRTAQASTLSDANGDLLDVFTTTRVTVGLGLAVGSPTLRLSLRAGLDLQISLADIAMTTDVDCKFFGPESDRCGGLFSADSPTVWLGIDFGLSLRWAPVREFYFTFSAGNASYIFAPSAAAELNFPLYGSLGFGLPF
ncbi:MAG: hypothetical protein U1F43_32135 [Myxococcota bacterium]